jgi:hypothetical protein
VNLTGEAGLLGMAFAPDYPSSGIFYLHYYNNPRHGMIVERYRRSPTNPLVADPTSAQTVLFYARSASIHHGGWIGFSPLDRMLYVSIGEGAGPANQLNSYGGKMLRLDVTPGLDDYPADANRNYAVPTTNPFRGVAGALPEIFLYGLRNPWRCSFDRATGDLYIGDVGDATPGCIFVAPHLSSPSATAPGLNFGYPCFDRGVVPTTPNSCATYRPVETFAFAYSRNQGNVTTGGFVYRGCAIPELRGRYLCMDYGSGACFSYPASAGPSAQLTQASPGVQPHTGLGFSVAGIGEDLYGELYVMNLSSGTLSKIVPVAPHFTDANNDGIPDDCALPACGPADVGSAGGLNGGDGVLDNNDLIVFINAFFAGDPRADMGRAGGLTPGDGAFDNNDFIAFINAFFAGCG